MHSFKMFEHFDAARELKCVAFYPFFFVMHISFTLFI